MKPQQAQAGSGGSANEDKAVSSGACIYLVQHARSGAAASRHPFLRSRRQISFLPVEEESRVQKAGIFYRDARYEHTGPVKRVKPIINARFRAVDRVSDP